MEKLTTKIKFLPPSATENISFISMLQNSEQDLKLMINQLETSESGIDKDIKNKIENIISDIIINIESLKKTFLK